MVRQLHYDGCIYLSKPMEFIKFIVKISNVVGYILIATIVLSPIGFIQVLLGYLVLLEMEGKEDKNRKII